VSIWSRPDLRFIRTAVVLTAAFVILYYNELFGRLLLPWAELTASAACSLLRFAGLEAMRAGSRILHPAGFAYEIDYRCTGLLPVAVFAILTLASPAPVKTKCAGLAAGIPGLLFLNLIRLVHLFHVGVHNPQAFGFAHGILWNAALAAATFGSWWLWREWASHRRSAPSGMHDALSFSAKILYGSKTGARAGAPQQSNERGLSGEGHRFDRRHELGVEP
jgi:exosortase/archaeosortase family protein